MENAYKPEITLGTIIAYIESHGNPKALRFEPLVYGRIFSSEANAIINRIVNIHRCTYHTAAVILSTSYGLFQIMGENIYAENGYDKTIFDYCIDIGAQLKMFNDFVIARRINYSVHDLLIESNRKTFAEHYNGPANIEDYSNHILESLHHFGITS